MTFDQPERVIGMLTAGMSASDVARHFQRHESTISRLLNRFQQTGNVSDRPRSGKPRKTTPREDRFLMTSSLRNRFLSGRKLGRLLRNATGKSLRQDGQEYATRCSIESVPSLRWHSADMTGVIEPVVVPHLQQHNVRIFQHDNARPHTARHTQNSLRIPNVNVLQWPARSLISLPLGTYGTT